MNDPIRTIDFRSDERCGYEQHQQEWLLTNGLGGYSTGTITGIATRRYHALLVAAFGAPLGRIILFNTIQEFLSINGYSMYNLTTEQPDNCDSIQNRCCHLQQFSLQSGLPVWRFQIQDVSIEKRIVMAHMQNTVYITYTILSSPEQCTLTLLPLIQFRQHDQPPSTDDKSSYIFTARSDRYEISSETSSITLKLYMHAPVKKFILEGGVRKNVFHVIEAQRGYEAAGSLWSPGVLKTTLKSGESATIIASSESWEAIMALSPSAA
ncbi:MAG: glycogen debranching protein, partial [Fibrobacter sp.]|nr:glycogen debranching protein [Fibrobacter sp.]